MSSGNIIPQPITHDRRCPTRPFDSLKGPRTELIILLCRCLYTCKRSIFGRNATVLEAVTLQNILGPCLSLVILSTLSMRSFLREVSWVNIILLIPLGISWTTDIVYHKNPLHNIWSAKSDRCLIPDKRGEGSMRFYRYLQRQHGIPTTAR